MFYPGLLLSYLLLPLLELTGLYTRPKLTMLYTRPKLTRLYTRP